MHVRILSSTRSEIKRKSNSDALLISEISGAITELFAECWGTGSNDKYAKLWKVGAEKWVSYVIPECLDHTYTHQDLVTVKWCCATVTDYLLTALDMCT